jgi:diguanylate cyclase (GGDEF)-like protein/PAS domain S-box-containing protein
MRRSTFWRRRTPRDDRVERLSAELAALGNRNPMPKVLIEETGVIRYTNAAAAAALGRASDALRHVDVFSLVHPEDEARAREDLASFVAGRLIEPVPEYAVRRGDGSWVHVAVEAMNLLDVPAAAGVLLMAQDVTAARAQERALIDLAFRDPITGIGNRRALDRDLANLLAVEQPLSVVFVDLDHFRRVNDSLGHTAGDELLSAVATRLFAAASVTSTVHHFSADTFVVTFPGLDGDRALEAAWRLLTAVARPLFVGSAELRVTGTAGVALREPGATAASLLRDADAALTRAKARRRGGVEVFTAEMRADALQRLAIETDLRRALQRDELALHLQPIVKLATREVIGSEALARWHRPSGDVRPELFVAVAEEAGLIGGLGDWVLQRAVQLLESEAAAKISVNLSPRQLFDPRLPARAEQLLAARGVRPQRLAFEITETVVVENHALASECLSSLRSLGCSVGLDDFGTGYSSLGYLRRLPVDFLKIDRSLVSDVADDSQAARIVEAISSLADALGLFTIAEGLERESQLEALVEIGVDAGQGWLLGYPALPRSD